MRRPTQRQKPRKTEIMSFPAPTMGLISNRNLAVPAQGGAAIMCNFFPTPQGNRLRRGCQRRATMPGNADLRALFAYNKDGGEQLFAATDDGIWDITSVQNPYPQAISPAENEVISDGTHGIGWYSVPEDGNLHPSTSGAWITAQYSTVGGTFMIGVNGEDPAFIYDGDTFEEADITFPEGSTLTTADLSYVWVYKSRIYFAQKGTLDAWYLPVDQIGGGLTLLPLGGTFPRGGSLLFGQSWSLSSGGDGGLSEQNTFCTTEGEVAIFQGLSPDDASTWDKVGVYSIGKPLGNKAWIRAGGDLVIATSLGFIPLSQAIDKDTAVLGAKAVSQLITDTWQEAVRNRGMTGWECEIWPENSMVVISTPTPVGETPLVLVCHADTGAWGTFSGWKPLCFEVFRGRLFMGSTGGKVQEAWVGGSDEGVGYTGTVLPLFDDMGTPMQRKIAKFARVARLSSYETHVQVIGRFDWNLQTPPAPNAVTIPLGNEWNNGIWDVSIWNTERGTFRQQEWRSVGGSGYAASVLVQVTSGAAVPLDVEIARIDLSYEVADIVT